MRPWLPTLLLLASLTVIGVACGGPALPTPESRPPGPGDLPSEEQFLADAVRTRGHRDIFLPIVDPEFVGADADHGVAPGETVVAVDLGTTQVCYPTNLLDAHEIVEHTIAGVDLLATW